MNELLKSQQQIEMKQRVSKRLEEIREKRVKEKEDREKSISTWLKNSPKRIPKEIKSYSDGTSISIKSLERRKDMLKRKREHLQTIDHHDFIAFEKEYLEKRKMFEEQKK